MPREPPEQKIKPKGKGDNPCRCLVKNYSVRLAVRQGAPFVLKGELYLDDTRIAVIGIVVESDEHISNMNALLSQYGDYIIGRMGIPHREKGVNIISVVLDAPSDIISALSGKLGRLEGINSKTLYSKV